MARREGTVAAPARERVGLPIVPDGSRRHPLLVRLPVTDDPEGACNNGCNPCLTRPVELESSAFDVDVAERHVVIRHREASLRPDLCDHVSALVERGAASVSLVTNGRMLVYEKLVRRLGRAGLDRIIVKLFGLDAAEHDGYTRAEASWDQALAGLEVARSVGELEVLVTFPRGHETGDRALRVALARRLTERDPVQTPEPEVEGHANEFRYDVVVLRQGIQFVHPYWTDSCFPMVHLNTGPICNIRCVYCNVHGGTDQRLYAVDYIERLMDDAARRVLRARGAQGVPTVDLIGGEPTLHPELPRLIRMARERGFQRVFICTNGVRLRRPGYLDELVSAGLTGIRLSFHDHRPDMANQLADVPALGTTYRDVATTLLGRTDLETHFFRILLGTTIDALPDYIRWLAAHNRTGRPVDLTLGMPSMRGRSLDDPSIYPRLDELRPAVDAAMKLAASLGFEPMIHHAPACLYPADTSRVACAHVTTMQFDAVSGAETVMNFEGEARFGAACDGCAARHEGCAGLPRAYFDADADAAEAWLQPVTFPAERYGG
jgi:molybdenum cofactor biosynthesis enzyme MoaA